MTHDPDEHLADDTAPTAAGPPAAPAGGPTHRRREGWRAALVWALGLVAVLGLTFSAAWAGVVLAVFGLGALVLLVGIVLLVFAGTNARRLVLPLSTIALALMLPAAAVQLTETRIDPSFGALIVTPKSPSDVEDDTYTRGFGPVLVDLRQFHAPAGSTTRIAARSDDERVVVALPRDRCFNLDIRYSVGDEFYSEGRHIARRAVALTGATDPDDGWMGFARNGLTLAEDRRMNELEATTRDVKRPAVDARVLRQNLLLFGTYPRSENGSVVRRAAAENAPTLELDLEGGKQVVVRDYPDWAGPLATGENGSIEQVAGTDWPAHVRAPLSPGEKGWRTRASIRTRENRARWVKWEREIVPWAKEQAKRLAGACATREDLARRAYRFYIQPEAYRDEDNNVIRTIGGPSTRHSAIEQPVAAVSTTVFAVEVDGLGRTRVVDQLSQNGIAADPVFVGMSR